MLFTADAHRSTAWRMIVLLLQCKWTFGGASLAASSESVERADGSEQSNSLLHAKPQVALAEVHGNAHPLANGSEQSCYKKIS